MTWPLKLPVDKWKNLYREKDGRPRLRRSVVAFIDLLGYAATREAAMGAFARSWRRGVAMAKTTTKLNAQDRVILFCAATGLPPPAPPVSESRRAFRRRPHRVPAAWYFLVVGYFDCGGGEISATKSQMMCATGCFGSPALLAGVCWTYLTCNRSHRPRSFKI